MYDRILVRFGDSTLKGKNKKDFINRIVNLTRNKLEGLNVQLEKRHDRLYIILNDEKYKDVVKRLDLVSGVHSYSPVVKCETNLEVIKETALNLIKQTVKKPTSYKVECKRANKNFELTSVEASKAIGAYVLRNYDEFLTVDVHNPEVTLHIDIKDQYTYIYTMVIKGLGGFPTGILGKGLLMISGGIDSPVAGFLSMKQGMEIECIHFESTPLTSIESAQKVIDLVKKMAKYSYNNKIKLHMVPFMRLHQELLNNVPESYNITIMRRLMYRIAEKVAKKNDCLVIINGESVGQVASQTLHSMQVVNNVTNMPVLRPLVTYDKNDIVTLSKKIDAFDISIKPFEDCCTVYVPKSPVTKPHLDKAELYESKINIEEEVNYCVENTKSIRIAHNSDLDITLLGLEVQECFDLI